MSRIPRSQLLMMTASFAGFSTVALMPQAAHSAQANVAAALDEVLVTARRREESLQDVPIAISAFGAANLESRGVDRIENLNGVAPNLLVMGSGNAGETTATFRVRGLPGVSVYIDGVDQPQTDGLLTTGIVEIDRIEVLRGPQGTLFGNASLGGAVSYVTKLPADNFGTRIRASVGSFSRRDIQAAVDLPLSDTLKMKVTASSQFRDGFMKSVLVDRAYGDINDQLVRADFLWKPADGLTIRYNVDKSNTNRNGPARLISEIKDTRILNGPLGPFNDYQQGQLYANLGLPYDNKHNTSGFPGGELGKWDTKVATPDQGLVIDQTRHTLDANWKINDTLRVRSISGYKDITRYTQGELDGSSQVALMDRDTMARQFSFGQELQLLGTHKQADWVVGAFYQQQYNRTRSNSRTLADLTCDLWATIDKTQRRVTNDQQASCFNTRRRALGVSSVPEATPGSNFGTTGVRLGLNNAVNPATNGGLTVSQFTSAVASTSDSMTITKPSTKAVFGDVTWRFSDALSVAAGLRYSEDQNDGNINLGTGANISMLAAYNGVQLSGVTSNQFGFIGPLPVPSDPTKYEALTKRLTVQYRWNPDLMTYFGYSDGYAPGGVSQVATVVPNYITLNSAGVATGGYARDIYNAGLNDIPLSTTRGEQSVRNFEVGARADWFGGSLRTNVTLFYTTWENVPTSSFAATLYWDTNGDGVADSKRDVTGDGVFDPVIFPNLFTVAALKAEAKGIELETNWRASDALRFNLNVGYLKTEYTELGDAGRGILPALAPNTPFLGAPELTAAFGGQYAFNLSNGAGVIPRIDYTYMDDYTLSSSAALQRVQKGFGMLNARVTYDSGSNWSVNVTGSNLTNEWYFNSGLYGLPTGINYVTVGRPREYGLSFDFRFD